MIKITKFYPKDLIAIIALLACFFLMAIGINHVVSLIVIMIITFYFARRIDGEGEPGKDINEKVKKLEEEIKVIPKTSQTPSSSLPIKLPAPSVTNVKFGDGIQPRKAVS